MGVIEEKKSRLDELEKKLQAKGKLALKEKAEYNRLKSEFEEAKKISVGNYEEDESILGIKNTVKIKSEVVNIYDIKPNPYQPRKYLTQKEIDDQAETIRSLGLIEKIIVCKDGDEVFLLAGQKRLEGLKKLNKEEQDKGLEDYEMKWLSIDVDVKEGVDINDSISMRKVSLAENLGRTNPLVIDTAVAISELYKDYKKTTPSLTQKDFGNIVGKELGIGSTLGTINKYLKIASLDKSVLDVAIDKNINSISILYQIAKSDKSNEEKINELEYVEEGKSLKEFEEENKKAKSNEEISAGNQGKEKGDIISAGNYEDFIDTKYLLKHISSINKCSSQSEAKAKAQELVDYLLEFISTQEE